MLARLVKTSKQVSETLTPQIAADLILKLIAVDAGPATARPRRVTTLDHKVLDDAMEDGIVVVATRGECRKVLARLGRVLVVELDDDGAL